MTVDAVSERDVDELMGVVPLESAPRLVGAAHGAAGMAIDGIERPGRFDRMDVDVGMPVGRTDAAMDVAMDAGIVRDRGKKSPMERMAKLFGGLNEEHADALTRGLDSSKSRLTASQNALAKLDPTQDEIEKLPDLDMIGDVVQEVGNAGTGNFPNVALEVVRLALKVENYQTAHKLNALQKEGHELKGKIELLLNLKGELQTISKKEAASYELSDKAKDLLRQLKEKEIDVFPGAGTTVTKVEMTEAKGRIESQISHHRTELQVLFSTKISVTVQFLNSMIDVVKNILKNIERANSKMIEGQRTR